MSDYEPKCKKTLPIIFDDRMPASNLTPKLVNRVNNNTEDLKNLYEETGDQFTLVKQDINELETTKADASGTYENLTAGTAEQLLTDKGVTDKVPYLLRASGGNGADREEDKIVGGTVAWNQLFQNGNFSNGTTGWKIYTASRGSLTATDNIATITYNDESSGGYECGLRPTGYSISVQASHKYLFCADIKADFSTTIGIEIGTGVGANKALTENTWNRLAWIQERPSWSQGTMILIKPVSATIVNGSTLQFRNLQFINLTQMFGTSIADRAYAMEQATAGSGINWLKSMGFFREDYYPYDAGTLKSVEGLTAHSMVGKNLVSGKLDACYINNVGKITDDTNYAMCYGKVIAGETYTITSDDSAGLVCGFFDSIPTKFADSYNNQRIVQTNKTITAPIDGYIAFRTSAEYANAQLELGSVATAYEPYKTWSYPLDSTLTLRGIPKLDSNNQLYYDGDEYASDGTVKRRFWVHTITSSDQVYGFSTNYDGLHGGSILVPTAYFGKVKGGTNTNGIADKYTVKYANIDKNLYVSGDGQRINIINDAYTTQEAWFAAIIGTTVVLELVESAYTTEEAEPYQNPQIIDPYGIEAYETTGIVPVGHDTFYPENLRKKIEGLPFNFATLIAPTESTYKATRAYSTGNLFIVNNILYKATTSIASGGTITPGTNCTATTLAEIIAALS